MKKIIIILISLISSCSMAMSENTVQVSIQLINPTKGDYDSSLITSKDDIKTILLILSKNIKNKILPEEYGSIMPPVTVIIKKENEVNQFHFSAVVDSKGSESGIAKEDIEKLKEIFKNNNDNGTEKIPK